ncbi:MAG: hypothetical protein A2958_02525 [Candidatus Levybacteria bacterium RIFCSPLOWO2_01_FULL_38_13]|nr:MAG: hypothetical protein A2629_02945 [Candidatus Levybacteria bacterium RIFCSPHIGHO2_01_FULL_41_15]OGH35213.1 MAG: hypothetical protein A2958_02525 [Candidatus Levybacteria bacterium RIFCSPLOWO2_01_FULL_38_13]
MKTEKVVLSFIAVLLGILVTGVAFYLYQATKKSPNTKTKIITTSVSTPTPKPSVFLSVKDPQNEIVVDKKVVTVSGTSSKDAVIVILTPIDQKVLTPSSNGDFSTTLNIDDGQNYIELTAIAPNGEETKTTRTVSFSKEEF